MKTVSLKNGATFDVAKFDITTSKKHPYYQNGKKYAVCPTCKSSVQLMGGKNNKSQSRRTKATYASHRQSEIQGLPFSERYKECLFYKGNKGNWQQIYDKSVASKNLELEDYIKKNSSEIAYRLTEFTGIGFHKEYDNEPNSLFNKLLNSFMEHRGLYCEYFLPDAVPLLLLATGEPVEFWGYKIKDAAIKEIIERNDHLSESLEGDQFKPQRHLGTVSLVAALNNNDNPKSLVIRLLWGNGRSLTINRLSANFWNYEYNSIVAI